MSTGRQPIEKRFWRKVQKSDGCWEWQGSKNAQGYGVITEGGKIIKAHRVSYRLHYGDIPDGLFVCHHCDNPCCVRPDHLFTGTALDNALDMRNKGRRAKKSGIPGHVTCEACGGLGAVPVLKGQS